MKPEIAREFFNSSEFVAYARDFRIPYEKAFEDTFHGRFPNDLTTTEQWGEFYQRFWENLPDSPSIRYGAFFRVCDFAEEYCFGEGEEDQ